MATLEMESLQSLPVEQRILLVEDVWDSIRPQAERISVPASHRQELDRRAEKYKNNSSALLDDRQLRQALGLRG
jgi:putative addiction module component (TIGR02574 family)